jgi:uncharacterized membrane protein YhaH (DUF805 family)
MKEYYYLTGKDREGPVTLEELKLLEELTAETLVWYEGLSTWVRAGEIAELSDVFASVPPPVTPALPVSFGAGVGSLFSDPFSFAGRIRRREYGLSVIISCCAVIVGYHILEGNEESTLSILIFCAVIIIANWFIFAQGAKRSHDIGKSGWWQLIPFYNLYILFAEGDRGYNTYGADPKRGDSYIPRKAGYVSTGGSNVNNNNVVVNVTGGYPPLPDTNINH